jgi:hypothetical protein
MKPSVDIAELIEFIDKYQPGQSLSKTEQRDIFKRPYKQYYAVLVWGLLSNKLLNSGAPEEIYFKESVSDLAHGILLTLFNFYKPARMSLRSACENYCRFLYLSYGTAPQNEKSTYEVIAAAQATADKFPNVRTEIDKIAEAYGELCLTVHSAALDYMALKIPFAELSQFESNLFGSNLRMCLKISSSMNKSLFGLWHQELHKLDHGASDFVRDSISTSYKKMFYA